VTNEFLAASVWADARGEFLAGDASARRYYRLHQGQRTAVLMDASQNRDCIEPFVRIDRHLAALGFSVPGILATDVLGDLLLLEDFGDASFSKLLATEPPLPAASPASLYTLATDVLIALHQHPQAIPAGLRAYDPAAMLADLELFLEWRVPGVSQQARAEFRAAWLEVLPRAHRVPRTLLLRDYHVANLMLLPDREGIRRAGLLDFQDAYQGPVTYDLVSLLEDARRDVSADLKGAMRARYLERFPGLDREVFDASSSILAAQRHLRVLGIFERLSRRDGRHDYKQLHSERVERLLERALEHRALSGVKDWLKRHGGAPAVRAPRLAFRGNPSAPRIQTAMVLAAGYGTRLRPLTDHTPKPLVPVAGKPMLGYALDRLRAYGVRDVVINVSYLKEGLKAYAAQCEGLRIRVSEEPEPLETGGGIKQALPLLGGAPFFTVNSDIIWLDERESALERLAACWDETRMDILLLAQPRAKAVGYDKGEDHLFVTRENTVGWEDEAAPYIMAGVGIMHPRVLADAPAGKFSIKVLWLKAMASKRLFCVPHLGRWFQAGTVASLRQTEAALGGAAVEVGPG
jgi:N-acetylmuramate 1-kinase